MRNVAISENWRLLNYIYHVDAISYRLTTMLQVFIFGWGIFVFPLKLFYDFPQ